MWRDTRRLQSEKQRRLESWGQQGLKKRWDWKERESIRIRRKESKRSKEVVSGQRRVADMTEHRVLTEQGKGEARGGWQIGRRGGGNSLSYNDSGEDDMMEVVVRVNSKNVKEQCVLSVSYCSSISQSDYKIFFNMCTILYHFAHPEYYMLRIKDKTGVISRLCLHWVWIRCDWKSYKLT